MIWYNKSWFQIMRSRFDVINGGYHTVARRYEFYVRVAGTISHSFAALTREILFLPLEHKIHIFSLPCNILYRLEVWSFCEMHHWIAFFLALRLSVQRFQMPLSGLSRAKRMPALGTIYRTDPLLQNMTEIVCLRWPCWITCANFSKSG